MLIFIKLLVLLFLAITIYRKSRRASMSAKVAAEDNTRIPKNYTITPQDLLENQQRAKTADSQTIFGLLSKKMILDFFKGYNSITGKANDESNYTVLNNTGKFIVRPEDLAPSKNPGFEEKIERVEKGETSITDEFPQFNESLGYKELSYENYRSLTKSLYRYVSEDFWEAEIGSHDFPQYRKIDTGTFDYYGYDVNDMKSLASLIWMLADTKEHRPDLYHGILATHTGWNTTLGACKTGQMELLQSMCQQIHAKKGVDLVRDFREGIYKENAVHSAYQGAADVHRIESARKRQPTPDGYSEVRFCEHIGYNLKAIEPSLLDCAFHSVTYEDAKALFQPWAESKLTEYYKDYERDKKQEIFWEKSIALCKSYLADPRFCTAVEGILYGNEFESLADFLESIIPSISEFAESGLLQDPVDSIRQKLDKLIPANTSSTPEEILTKLGEEDLSEALAPLFRYKDEWEEEDPDNRDALIRGCYHQEFLRKRTELGTDLPSELVSAAYPVETRADGTYCYTFAVKKSDQPLGLHVQMPEHIAIDDSMQDAPQKNPIADDITDYFYTCTAEKPLSFRNLWIAICMQKQLRSKIQQCPTPMQSLGFLHACSPENQAAFNACCLKELQVNLQPSTANSETAPDFL
jgi:hypothetical protein